ncbi:WD repeat-containing protein on Y chromosome [Ischnura elegans]|uniref:WD repeat-containing protein on Y chromosome n=1 Tax=Ischnura elegans TaxID=197161 RepID=UPI001ED8AF7B|nr:WD repeat-containing protein on Y chromosome [Ischnura elegans]
MSALGNAADETGENDKATASRSVKLTELGTEEIRKMHEAFQKSKNKMSKVKFKELIEKVMKASFNEEDYSIFFMMMDARRTGAVDWDQFLSRLIIELQGNEQVVTKATWKLPLCSPVIFLRSNHRHPITKILFFPAIKQDKTPNFLDGRFVTLSKDGAVNFWSPTFELEKSCFSKTHEKRIHPTWITDMICLPDINMIATSSTERDLRFYDTMAMRFELRIVISDFSKAVTCMAYHMGNQSDAVSHIVTGDMGGHVRIFSFGKGLIIEGRPEVKRGGRGPFSFTAGDDVKVYSYKSIKKGVLPLLLVTEYLESHPKGEWVKQVAFCPTLRSFISCCACASEKSLVLRDVRAKIRVDYEFNVPNGVHCFCIDEESYTLATGGSDCVVRVWNAYMPKKHITAFTGHDAAISGLIFVGESHILSISSDKCIKIWNYKDTSLLQSYSKLSPEIGKSPWISMYFHPQFKRLIVGSLKLAILPYGPPEDKTKKDGTTHYRAATTALYNTLFKCLVTVGNDSAIMIWDVWTGKCLSLTIEAHYRMEYGVKMPVEITAAAFDPTSHQFLVTGARDGSLKIWNFNSGLCVRHMTIEKNCEVTSVLWLQNRLLAVGWNRHITEFADLDSGEPALDENRRGSIGSTWPTIPRCAPKFIGSDLADVFDGKSWETRHTDDVVCAVANPPQAIATASYNGELILWRLETGQPYRRYHVGKPFNRMKLEFKKKRPAGGEFLENPYASDTRLSLVKSHKGTGTPSKKTVSIKTSMNTSMAPTSLGTVKSESIVSSKSISSDASTSSPPKASELKLLSFSSQKLKRMSSMPIDLPPEQASIKPVVIYNLLFLNARQCLPDVGTLLVSVEGGNIQVWCHCLTQGIKVKDEKNKQDKDKKENVSDYGFLGSFLAVHSAGDYVVTMNTDEDNEFLFTGDSAGYLKVWLLKNYFSASPSPKIVMPKYRILFPFLLKDRLNGRAKRAIKGQELPLLLSSYQAHLRAITHVEYIREAKIVVTCSSDFSVRVWSLGGRYIGTLGQQHPWPNFEPGKEVEDFPLRIPSDLVKVASFTSMKVFTGAPPIIDCRPNGKAEDEIIKQDDEITRRDIDERAYGRRLDKDNILGTHFELPKRSGKLHPPPKIDRSYGFLVPAYEHIDCPPPTFFEELTTPETVLRVQKQRDAVKEENIDAQLSSRTLVKNKKIKRNRKVTKQGKV